MPVYVEKYTPLEARNAFYRKRQVKHRPEVASQLKRKAGEAGALPLKEKRRRIGNTYSVSGDSKRSYIDNPVTEEKNSLESKKAREMK